jgi:dTDP-4-amino-4,6-dideoxygalactose transaminase
MGIATREITYRDPGEYHTLSEMGVRGSVPDKARGGSPGWLVPLARPELGNEEITAAIQSLKSGWLTSGPKVKEFEADFARFIGPGVQAVAVNSNTMGLLLALQALGIGPGDEVITTTNTFVATAMSIVHAGALPVLVDIDPATLMIDAAKAEAAITPRTKAIVPVHIGGLACNMAAIDGLARRHGLKVVEDAAHAFPTTHRNRLIGHGTSDATVFSFYASKTITTGEGGMITTTDENLANQLRRLRLHGIDKDIFDRDGEPPQSWSYDVLEPGHKANMPDVAAAIGVEQLKKAAAFHERRTEIAQRYNDAFARLPLILPPQAPAGDRHAWHLYIVRLAPQATLSREAFVARLAERGVQCSVHFIPLHRLAYWRKRLDGAARRFPEADAAFERSVTLPLYSAMSDGDVDCVISAVRRALA